MIIDGLEGKPIELDCEKILKIHDELTEFLHDVNRRSKYQIWGKPDDFYDLITGSFGEAVSDCLLSSPNDVPLSENGFTTINDIDVMIPIGSSETLQTVLREMAIPNRKVSTQVHSIVVIGGRTIQIDFAIKSLRMVSNDFTERTAFWHLADRDNGIKSVYYQLLLGSLTAVNHDEDALSISYGLRVRNDDPERRQYETDTKKIIQRLLNIPDAEVRPRMINNLSSVEGICFLMDKFLDDAAINRVLAKFEHRLEGLRKTEKYNRDQEHCAWKVIDRVLRNRPILGSSHAPSTSLPSSDASTP